MLKSFRYLLFPFSLAYGGIILLRNFLFDKGLFKSSSFNFPIICVGNLALGGTGKTPMTEYLAELLQDNFNTATLSRGYKRKTKGYTVANELSTAIDIGDEPMQFHTKFPGITVAVGEERLVALPQLLHDRPKTEVIILDDGFQHRSVRAGLNILLTEYANRYSRDLMLPAGDLRDVKKSAKRANIITVTKCKTDLTEIDKQKITAELNLHEGQSVFFTELVYMQPYHLFTKKAANISALSDLLLVTGIANPRPMKDFLAKHVRSYDMLRYADHHIFSSVDLTDIKKHFERLPPHDRYIITTEKDAVRLLKFKQELEHYPVLVLPVKHRFLFDEGEGFNKLVFDFIQNCKKVER